MSKHSNDIIEVSNLKEDNLEKPFVYGEKQVCKSSVYGEKNDNGDYIFCDLRTKVNYKVLSKEQNFDFSTENLSSLDRLKNFKLSGVKFSLDYCKTDRKKYRFSVISDLYQILWGISMKDSYIDSAETLISADRNIVRCRSDINKRRGVPPGINWNLINKNLDEEDEELENFAKAVATIGNFMPVPSKHQKLLSFMEERFDKVLNLIKVFYICYDFHISTDFLVEDIKSWLMLYWTENSEKSWRNFVDSNYLKGSFVNEKYDIIKFNGKLEQLSEIIYNRSVVMLEEYEKRISKITEE